MKTRKPEVGTWYALRDRTTGTYYPDQLGDPALGGKLVAFGTICGVPFPQAMLFQRRPSKARVGGSVEVVDVRCRPLSTRTKRSAKRTR